MSGNKAIIEDAQSDGAGGNGVWRELLRFGLTIVLFALLFSQIRWHDVWAVIRTLDGQLFLWVCALWIPTQYLQFLRWDLLAREAGEGVSRGDIHRAYWVGFTLGLVTPGRVGQFGRALALHNCSLPRAVGLSAMERAYSAITINGLGLLALVALPLLRWVPPFPWPGVWAQAICVFIGMAILALGLVPRTVYIVLSWIGRKFPFRDKIERALEVLKLAGPGRGAVFMILAIASLFSALLQFVLLLRAAGAPVPIFAGMLAALLTFFLKGALPISIGSLGVGEWSAVYCLKGIGVEPSIAVAVSLVLFAINVFVPSLIGLPFIGTLRVFSRPRAKAAS
jgi:uncharacterized protein (TIRG00374 family)